LLIQLKEFACLPPEEGTPLSVVIAGAPHPALNSQGVRPERNLPLRDGGTLPQAGAPSSR
jgi:hypothetical protein